MRVYIADGSVWTYKPNVIQVYASDGTQTDYLPERICHSDNEPPLLYDDPFRVFRCSECHHKVDLRFNRKPNYCPNCGARVKN